MESLYENKNSRVASGAPHVTLLYGLMKPATDWKQYVDEVLAGWSCATVTVERWISSTLLT